VANPMFLHWFYALAAAAEPMMRSCVRRDDPNFAAEPAYQFEAKDAGKGQRSGW
jgi:hypothetical protein